MAKIFLDPGHGGSDPGAISGTRTEKVDNLIYALELERLFKAQGHVVIMARWTDATLTPEQRIAQANAAGADVYISCHRNAGGGTGIELWLHHQAPARYIAWAQDMIVGFKPLPMPIRNSATANRVSEGVFRGYPGQPTANFAVNRDTKMPSMLIELGFMGKDDAVFDSHYKAYAAVIARSTCKFLGTEYREPAPVQPPTDDTAAKLQEALAQRDAAVERAERAEGKLVAIQNVLN